ncbi:MAG: hypothetical protein FJX59_18540 [Alphaproteobacteria bacterium]|nr:hypothetical protein [Alphaproteobacteria bacterium]
MCAVLKCAVLKAPVIIVMVLTMTGFLAASAMAVDVVNKDKQDRTITIVTPDGRKTVTVPAGGTVANVCGACTIEVSGGARRDASGGQKVTLSGPMLLVSGQP